MSFPEFWPFGEHFTYALLAVGLSISGVGQHNGNDSDIESESGPLRIKIDRRFSSSCDTLSTLRTITAHVQKVIQENDTV